jgi:PIH1 N-terminal domain
MFVSVKLKPSAGFVVKSTTLNDASSTLPDMGMLVQKGLKVFVNIAWDSNVPPPPEGSEEVIQKAMLGEHLDDLNPEGWYIPVIVSGGRQDKDKGAHLFLDVALY